MMMHFLGANKRAALICASRASAFRRFLRNTWCDFFRCDFSRFFVRWALSPESRVTHELGWLAKSHRVIEITYGKQNVGIMTFYNIQLYTIRKTLYLDSKIRHCLNTKSVRCSVVSSQQAQTRCCARESTLVDVVAGGRHISLYSQHLAVSIVACV